MDYLDVQLYFDDIVEDNRKLEALIDAEAGVTHVTYIDEEWSRKWIKGRDDESVGQIYVAMGEWVWKVTSI